MKVYFTASYNFRNTEKETYEYTARLLKKKFGEKNVYYATDEIDVPFTDKNEKAPKDILTATKFREKALKDSDLIIADVTKGSAGIGYNISLAVTYKKPVLVIKQRGSKEAIVHHPIDSGKIRQIIFKEYENKEDLDKVIDYFVRESKNILDTKFILIIPAEIDRYLEWSSDYKRMHKAQIVRNAIEAHMESDPDWQEFLSED